MNFQVVVSEKAQEELQEIYDYIADTGFPQTAEKVIAELKEAILSLNYMPERCRLFDVEPWKSKGVRVKVTGAYGIYYTVGPTIQSESIMYLIAGWILPDTLCSIE